MTDEIILPVLYGRLWHTTHPDRYSGILTSGAILPEPNLPDLEREKTRDGKDGYSFVRALSGVSLFDFKEFDPDAYSARCPSSCWSYFVPHNLVWGRAIWIEIDRDKVASQLISGLDLLARWKTEEAYKYSIMPEIEAAHLGPLPRIAFKRAFGVSKADNRFHNLPT